MIENQYEVPVESENLDNMRNYDDEMEEQDEDNAAVDEEQGYNDTENENENDETQQGIIGSE